MDLRKPKMPLILVRTKDNWGLVILSQTVLLLPFLASENEFVAFHEFACQQEAVNGGDAIGYKAGYKFTLATGLLG